MNCRIWSVLLLIAASSLIVLGDVPQAQAANYALTTVPSRTQESNTPGVILSINVTGATVGATYKFTWQVTDSSGAMHQASNQTGAGGAASSFVLSVSYPSQFGTNVNYVGNYTINVQQNNPTVMASVATGEFQVGLTDGLSYQPTSRVYISARGYSNNSPVVITVSQNGTSAPGYPTIVTTSSTGTISTIWNIPANISPGQWIISLSGSPAKTVLDTQTVTVTSTTIPVVPPQSSLNLYYFLIAALAVASGSSVLYLFRRHFTVEESFDEFFKLTGGELPPATTLLITGDAGSGVSTLALELTYRQLSKGGRCGVLSYDALPSEVDVAMQGMGWDVSGYLKEGSFKIVDCYSGLAGNEHAPLSDPLELETSTMEYYRQIGEVSSIIDEAKAGPVTILVDSVTSVLIAPPRVAMNFLRVLGAKVRNNQGVMIITATKGSILKEAWPSLENMVDGVVEITMARSGDSLIRRLTVKRLTGRKVSPVPTEFEIVAGRGILFRKLRISLKMLSPRRRTGPPSKPK
jgi:KaiC/GvpD/RAD55 family RecA-like ATPase